MDTDLSFVDRFALFVETIGFGSFFLGFILLAVGLVVLFALVFR